MFTIRTIIVLIAVSLTAYVPATYAQTKIELDWAGTSYQPQQGQWSVGKAQTEVYNIEHKDIYMPQQEPGWVSWVNVWKELDGTLKCIFKEAIGDPALWPPVNPNYIKGKGINYGLQSIISRDQGNTWTDTGWNHIGDHSSPLITVVMPDGSLLRALRNPDFIERSTDGGQSWQEVSAAPPDASWTLLRCRDGRLVLSGGARALLGVGGIVVWESLDEGKTWSELSLVIPATGQFENVALSVESSMVELSDGRVLMVVRTDKHKHFVQAYLTRTGPGKYVSEVKFTPMPHSGHPYLVKCADGAIWYAGHGALWITLDEAVTWQKFNICESYYPQMVEIEPGCILNITQYRTGDSIFPYPRAVSIRQTRFNYLRSDVLTQSNVEAPIALSVVGKAPITDDVHLRLYAKADGFSGVAFRIQSEPQSSYYVYMLQLELPETKPVKPGTKAKAYNLLGKVEAGKLTTLRRIYLRDITIGEWVQMQVRTQGDLIQACIRPDSESKSFSTGYPWDKGPYIAVRDSSLKQGKVGVVTAASIGNFKNMELVDPSKLIRDSWYK